MGNVCNIMCVTVIVVLRHCGASALGVFILLESTSSNSTTL